MAVLLIEHDTSLVMRVSERVSVLDHGIMIAEGTPKRSRPIPRSSRPISAPKMRRPPLRAEAPVVLSLSGVEAGYGRIGPSTASTSKCGPARS